MNFTAQGLSVGSTSSSTAFQTLPRQVLSEAECDKIAATNIKALNGSLRNQAYKVKYCDGNRREQSIGVELTGDRIYVRYANGDLCALDTVNSSVKKIANVGKSPTWIKFSGDHILALQNTGELTWTNGAQSKVLNTVNAQCIPTSADILVFLDQSIFFVNEGKIMRFNPQTSECEIFFNAPLSFGKIDKIETDQLNLFIHSVDGDLLVVDKLNPNRTVLLNNIREYKIFPYESNPLLLFVDSQSVMHAFDSESYERYPLKDIKTELKKVHYDNLSKNIHVLVTEASAQQAKQYDSHYSRHGVGISHAHKKWQVIFTHKFLQFNRKFELMDSSPPYEVHTTQDELPISYYSESVEIGDSIENKDIAVYASDSRPFVPSTEMISIGALEVFGNYYFCHHASLGKRKGNVIFLKQNNILTEVLAQKSEGKLTWLQNGTYLKINSGLRIAGVFSNSIYVTNLTKP